MAQITSGSLTIVDVTDGAPGLNNTTVFLYRRAVSAPDKPTGNLTYTFSTASITGALGGWVQSINELTGSDPIWMIAAVASSNGETDVIESSEWAGPIKMAQNGQDGLPGTPGTNGLNQATIFIYKRDDSATAPSKTIYTFATGDFTVPSGWSKTIPTEPKGKPCWVTSAIAIGAEATTELNWVTPSVLVENGSDGISPIVTTTGNGVKIVDAEGHETYITNGTDGTSYYTFVRYSENADGSEYVATPTSETIYIGVYTGTASSPPVYNDGGWTWSKYVGIDGQPGTPGAQGPQGVSVTATRELYYLKTNSTDPAQITNANQIHTTDDVNQWTSIVPTYIGSGKYYTCIETTLSSGNIVWSAPVENKGLTDANTNAANAIEIARGVKQHFFWIATDKSENIPAGAYIAEQSEESFYSNPVKGNILTRSDGIWIRNGVDKLATLQGSGLTFLVPTGNYKGQNSVTLNGSGLTFYNIGSSNSAAATLASDGLQITNGSIILGTIDGTSDGNVALSNVDFTRAINGISRSNLRFAIGKNFGVKNDGTLYGTNVDINGRITAIAGLIGGWNIGTDTNKSLYYGNQVPGATTTNLVISKGSAENTNAIAGSGLNKTWFLTAGRQFGVDTDGILYASGANIQGQITVSAGSNVYTKDEVDDAVGGTATDLANYILSNDKAIEDLENQIDGAIDTWYYNVDPTTSNEPAINWTTDALKESHLRDLYFNTSNGHTFRWAQEGNTYKWIQIEDADAIKALADAAKAQTTADVKRRVFVAQPTPPYDIGDLWVQGSSGDIYKCKVAKTSAQSYTASDWDKASKYTDDSSFNTFKTTTYATDLQQTNEAISLRATKTEAQGYANTAESNAKADTTNKLTSYYTKTETDSAITQKAGEISLSVAQTEISKIEIGGKNLIWDTEWNDITNRWANWGSPVTREIVTINTKRWLHVVTTTTSFQGYSQNPSKRNGYGEIKAGDELVVSYSAYAKTAGQVCTVGCHWLNSSGTIVGQNWFPSTLTTSEKRYSSGVFIVPENAVGFNVMVGDGTTNAQELWISEVQIEKGNKATDWTPAPEDLEAYTDTQVSAAKAEIKVTTDGISSEVSQKVGNSEVISKINQSAEAIKIQASKIEIDGTATFNAIKSNVENTVNTAVNDIEIGGRNLVEKSNNGNIYTWMQNKGAFAKTVDDLGATFTITTLPEANSWGVFVDNGTANVVEKIEAGAEYRVSFDLRTSVAISNLLIAASVRKTNGAEPFTTGTTISLNTTADTWHHIVASTTAVATLPDVDDQRLYISMPKLKEQLGSFSIKNVKLEKGNKATDWTPAPEDIEVDLTNTANDLEQRMSTTEGTISTLSGTIDEQKDSIDDLKTKTNANSNNILTNAKAISTIQGEQTEIHNSISQVASTTYELDTRIADIEKGVVIDPNEPSVSVVSQNGAVKVTDEKVMIKGAGNTVSWADEESFNAKRLVSSDIRPRYITFANNGQVTTTGSFALIGRSNGHMSIIRTLT